MIRNKKLEESSERLIFNADIRKSNADLRRFIVVGSICDYLRVICGNLRSRRIFQEPLKAVSVIEYSILIAVVVAALIGMQFYIRRAVCGRWREAADTFGFGRQFSVPGLIWDR